MVFCVQRFQGNNCDDFQAAEIRTAVSAQRSAAVMGKVAVFLFVECTKVFVYRLYV